MVLFSIQNKYNKNTSYECIQIKTPTYTHFIDESHVALISLRLLKLAKKSFVLVQGKTRMSKTYWKFQNNVF